METPQSITQWAEETFGAVDLGKVASRTMMEYAELCAAIGHGEDKDKIKEEIADVAIMSWQLLHRCKGELASPIEDDSELEDCEEMTLYTIGEALVEFFTDVHYGNGNNTRPQCATGCISKALEDLAYHYDMDLHQAVTDKMKINRERTWKTDANGLSQHE